MWALSLEGGWREEGKVEGSGEVWEPELLAMVVETAEVDAEGQEGGAEAKGAGGRRPWTWWTRRWAGPLACG